SVNYLSRGILPLQTLINTVNTEDTVLIPLVLVGLAQLVLHHKERSPESNGQEGDGLRGESPPVVHMEGKTLRCPSVVDERARSLGRPGGLRGRVVRSGTEGHSKTRSVAGQHSNPLNRL
ncbi:hypothetical protein PMAYCL1PPCAC_12550, partial [Pristionchus mayeri]